MYQKKIPITNIEYPNIGDYVGAVSDHEQSGYCLQLINIRQGEHGEVDVYRYIDPDPPFPIDDDGYITFTRGGYAWSILDYQVVDLMKVLTL